MKRRSFALLLILSLPITISGLSACHAKEPPEEKIKVAVVTTILRHRSHSDVILENFLLPYVFNGKEIDPREKFEIASLYLDQVAGGREAPREKKDISQGVARAFDIPIYETIEEALCLGGEKLAVDAILIIAEHGNYPRNAKDQQLYPKKRFFDEMLAVFEKSGRVVPVYNDKHLSHSWNEAKTMYNQSQSMGFALMASSSVPLAERKPAMEVPPESKIEEAILIHGGVIETSNFHGLEAMQSILEWREGMESGVAEVQALHGDALWEAAEQGLWSPNLAKAAMQTEFPDDTQSFKEMCATRFPNSSFFGILIHYKDGTRATILKMSINSTGWYFACKIEDDPHPLATRFYTGPWRNRGLFPALSHAIQSLFQKGQSPYSLERTLMTSGLLAAAMESHSKGGVLLKTPQLEFSYQPVNFNSMREMGATWEIITKDMLRKKELMRNLRKNGQ